MKRGTSNHRLIKSGGWRQVFEYLSIGLTLLVFAGSIPQIALAADTAPVAEPGILSLLPSLVAIALALLLRQVIPAIFAGVLVGAILVQGMSITGIWQGLLDTFGVYIVDALKDEDHVSILFFGLMIGGLVGIISKNGGMAGIVRSLSAMASTRERGQLATSILGTAIFFDDYANTMIVGNTMRPITDRLRISREKLAYLVDSTAAPIASLALITTWIGFQVGLIDDATQNLPGMDTSAYMIFIAALPFGFYVIFAIIFVYLIAATGRDFGPMLHAEQKALSLDPFESETSENPSGASPRALNAVLPLAVLVFGGVIGIYVTGKTGLPEAASLREIIGNGDSYLAMIWASSLAVLVAVILSLASKSLDLEEAMEAWMEGVKVLMPAIVILTLAWSLSGVNEALQTAAYLSQTLSGHIPPPLLPTLIFLIAAAMAFATGSSWGVMGILIPLTIPLSWAVVLPMGGDVVASPIFLASVAALLSGAVWGDHCSPISDTTILSSMASGCDHMAHVRTQFPYALTVGIVAVLSGLIPAGYGVSVWLCLAAGIAILVGVILAVGKRPSIPPDNQSNS
jgi:Na+/H+ antiporter NhaC